MPFTHCPKIGQQCPHYHSECEGDQAERCVHVVAARLSAWTYMVVSSAAGIAPRNRALEEAIRGALGDEGRAIERANGLDHLTDRELEVLRQCLTGKDNREISGNLHISIHTVKNHMKAIFRKLEVKSRAELFGRFALMSDGPR